MEIISKKRISDEETREMQICILGIMKAIHTVCQEHGLRYYLIAGTMLGAVRHKGFIPWDDDADVALPRPDYNKLLAHANEWLPKEYELVCSDNNPDYPYQFARIQDKRTTYILRRSFDFIGGVPVDVFPIDGMTEEGLGRKWHYMRYYFWMRHLYYRLTDPYKHGKGLRSVFINMMHRLLSAEKIHRRLDNIMQEYDFDKSAYAADHDNRPNRGILPKEVYGEPTPVAFEDTTLMGVAQPDVYLKYCYGNYMEMPKEIPPQNFRYLDMKKPYKDFIAEGGEHVRKS